MPGEFPPFGGTDDADIENALQWFLGFLDAGDWRTRVAAIERNIESGMQPRTRHFDAEDYASAYGGRDRIAWYLYLVHTAQHDPLKYEPTQGARILPIFKRLGADLALLKRMGGVEERVQRLLGGGARPARRRALRAPRRAAVETQRLPDRGVHPRTPTGKVAGHSGPFWSERSGSSSASGCGKAPDTASGNARSGSPCGRGSSSTSLATTSR